MWFGPPTLSLRSSDPRLRSYVARRRQAGWSSPPRFTGSKVVVYEVVSGPEMIVVYYFLDEKGRLTGLFVSET